MGAARPQFVLGAGRSAGDGHTDTSGDSAPHFGHGHDVGSFPVRLTSKGPCVGHENGHSITAMSFFTMVSLAWLRGHRAVAAAPQGRVDRDVPAAA